MDDNIRIPVKGTSKYVVDNIPISVKGTIKYVVDSCIPAQASTVLGR